MTRTKIRDRQLPDYTRGEEIFNFVSHIVGGAFGIIALVSSVLLPAFKGNVWGIVGGAIYGGALVLLYTVSSVYHALNKNTGKKVMQVIDHCTIYFLIGGTYTPILFCAVRPLSPAWAWTIFSLVWGCAATAAVFTAIDLKKYEKFSMACYIGAGWCIILALKITIEAIGIAGFLWLLAGGVSYTVGAVLYGLGKHHRYMHSVFHLFVVVGSILQYICIIFYVL